MFIYSGAYGLYLLVQLTRSNQSNPQISCCVS